jgi:O-methyltransferase involved in polyketide biosynthesis
MAEALAGSIEGVQRIRPMAKSVHFTKERETLLITLHARALQSRSNDPVLKDKWAEDAIGRINYDFGKIQMRSSEALSIAMRAKQFDIWTAEYIAAHPDATILHLGCGMDSRAFRLNPPPSVCWFDVDYPDVIELRASLYPERPGYRMIGSPLADLGWLDELPRDRPAMIVAEGVTMYLTVDIVKRLLNRLTGHFPSGQIAFDAVNRIAMRMARMSSSIRATGASFSWGISHAHDIKRLDPKITLIRKLRTPELPGYAKLPWSLRALVRLVGTIPTVRRMHRLLLYRF